MKYKILFLIALFSVVSYTQEAQPPDIRNVRWGMTFAEVEAADNVKLTQNPNNKPGCYVVNIQFQEVSTDLSFDFINNQLKKVAYSTLCHKTMGMDVFIFFNQALIEKYGEPTLVISDKKMLWKNPRTVIIQELDKLRDNTLKDMYIHIISYYSADYYAAVIKSKYTDL